MSFRWSKLLFQVAAVLIPLGIAVITDGFDRLLLALVFGVLLLWIWRELHDRTVIATSRVALDALRQRQRQDLPLEAVDHSQSNDPSSEDRTVILPK